MHSGPFAIKRDIVSTLFMNHERYTVHSTEYRVQCVTLYTLLHIFSSFIVINWFNARCLMPDARTSYMQFQYILKRYHFPSLLLLLMLIGLNLYRGKYIIFFVCQPKNKKWKEKRENTEPYSNFSSFRFVWLPILSFFTSFHSSLALSQCTCMACVLSICIRYTVSHL